MAFQKPLLTLVALALAITSVDCFDMVHGRRHFQHWFSQYESHFVRILRDNCSEPYQRYLHDPVDIEPNCDSCYMQPAMNCLLDNFDEFPKAQMAGTGILLGLLPTVVMQMSSNTVETGLLALRRPFLAFLLSAASPAVSADSIRAFDSDNIREILRRPGNNGLKEIGTVVGTLLQPEHNRFHRFLMSIIEYLVAFVAVLNVAMVTSDLFYRAVFAMAPATLYLPMLYIFLALIIYICGAITVFIRVQVEDKPKLSVQGVWQRFKKEFKPYAAYPRKELKLHVKGEKPLLWLATWFTRTGTVVFFVFGTSMFSSILFVGPVDGLKIISRFFGSALLCRIIMVNELVGMSRATEVLSDEGCKEGEQAQLLEEVHEKRPATTVNEVGTWDS